MNLTSALVPVWSVRVRLASEFKTAIKVMVLLFGNWVLNIEY